MGCHGIGNNVLLDVGCGSGQGTQPWCDVFKRCIGTDISEAQIKCARENLIDKENLEFHTWPSHDMPLLGDGSVDMVTCGQAWHWMDHSLTIPEIRRVVKSPGCIAIYGYGNTELVNPSADEVIKEFYSITLNGYWHANRRHIDELYEKIPMVYPCETKQIFRIKKLASLSDYIGYVSTWSAYIKYKEQNHGGGGDPLKTVRKKIEDIIGNGKEIEFIVPFFLYLSKND